MDILSNLSKCMAFDGIRAKLMDVSCAQVLEKHQHYSQKVARNGFDLVHAVLTPSNVMEYWFRLMTAYSDLQTFSPTLHPDALPLTESNTHGGPAFERLFDERTCNMCPHMSSEGHKGLYASSWYKSMSQA